MNARNRSTDLDLSRWTRRRLRLVGGALGVGLLAGVLGTLLGTALLTDPSVARTKTFALGALCLGLGLLGWSGSVFAGPGIENMHRHLDSGSDWSETDSRRAMARLGGFGAGVMAGVVLAAQVI
ncbi:hypothetical protein VB773_06710 [Haloarculaceae archaeon H-GB2-1]|nr:hypothetical protein [Haloarculaceae archaeon H-GB1-1]MEA5385787.1 hypothetical protein [Haloarculaceae archaeon H-GB11]MEA5407289.1 hypothetical protein [Haloarculaceae archaeon H-GB2-1]